MRVKEGSMNMENRSHEKRSHQRAVKARRNSGAGGQKETVWKSKVEEVSHYGDGNEQLCIMKRSKGRP